MRQRRRQFLAAAASAGGLATAVLIPEPAKAAGQGITGLFSGGKKEEKETGAVEDLMREHGVLRRALLVYSASATKLHKGNAQIDPTALNATAKLFRSFGEDYHEKQLEETTIFPAVKKAGGPAGAYPDILFAQHQRGREITDYVMGVAGKGSIGTADAEPLALALESFVTMYRNHAAREDTIVFPAWKNALSDAQIREAGETFEDIEHRMFGSDGFENAVQQIGNIEAALGLADLSQFTAPLPPKTKL